MSFKYRVCINSFLKKYTRSLPQSIKSGSDTNFCYCSIRTNLLTGMLILVEHNIQCNSETAFTVT